MTKVLFILVAVFFATLAVVTAIERVNGPRVALSTVETRADRRKNKRG